MMSDKRWTRIEDHKVTHIWKKDYDDDCGEGPKEVNVSPEWYEANGTPCCWCGQDMVYSHTEVCLDG